MYSSYTYIICMKTSWSHKIDIIRDINDMFLSHGKNPISPQDFDTLWDLDVDGLIQAQLELQDVLKHSMVESK